jgi:hypothetical protein
MLNIEKTYNKTMIKPIYPPRPKNAVPASYLHQYEGKSMLGQPKLNGSQGVLYMESKSVLQFMNRHKQIMTNVKMSKSEFGSLYSGKGQMILCGEYLNKNKKHIDGKDFNHKYIIFDILMYDGVHLLGKTFEERQKLLDRLFPNRTDFDGFIEKLDDHENVYRVKNFYNSFKELYDKLTPIDMYEGLVLKKKRARLEDGRKQDNNSLSMLKFRKPCRNYSF